MALDACCTTRHWLSDCASAWLAYWFLPPQASPLPTSPVLTAKPNWPDVAPKMAPRPPTHLNIVLSALEPFFVLLLCFYFTVPRLGAVFPIKGWKVGSFRNMPAVRISPVS